MNWTISGDAQLARHFEQEDVWKIKWDLIHGEQATVTDHRDQLLRLPIWEATFKGKRKRFAADEVSNSVWIFALPQASTT